MEDLFSLLRQLFESQQLAVLSTQGSNQPYASLVAFAPVPDLRHLLFATTRSTRKYANLEANPQVSLLVDNRSNREADFHEAMATTAVGPAREVSGAERERYLPIYIKRHPYLVDFVSVDTCALIRVTVDAYYLVRRFQNVDVIRMAQ